MERMTHRSTSLMHLLAELRQQELLAEAERRRQARPTPPLRTILGLPIPGRRPHR